MIQVRSWHGPILVFFSAAQPVSPVPGVDVAACRPLLALEVGPSASSTEMNRAANSLERVDLED